MRRNLFRCKLMKEGGLAKFKGKTLRATWLIRK
jgi:hypothetical protein